MTREELKQHWKDAKRKMALQQIRVKEAPFRDADGFIVVSDVMKAITSPESFEAMFREAVQIG